jgi:hypothetical protein
MPQRTRKREKRRRGERREEKEAERREEMRRRGERDLPLPEKKNVGKKKKRRRKERGEVGVASWVEMRRNGWGLHPV